MSEVTSSVEELEVSDPEDARQLQRQAEEAGYLYCPALLPPEKVAALQHVAAKALCQAGLGTVSGGVCLVDSLPEDPDFTALQPGVQGSPAFLALRSEPDLQRVLSALPGAPGHAGWGDVFRVGVPGMSHWTTPAHQDRSYLRCPSRVWTAWLPLMDCPRSLGPLAVLHGSHRQGLLDHQHAGPRGMSLDDLPGDWRSADFGIGDVCLFQDFLIHRALPNQTAAELRLSVDYRFSDVAVTG